ncbi:MAG TPA: tetratricopeptide repeat protein [Chitinophagaceae bacterium]|nr:tetratricopeptide repeat protein [Chitinophagaceae bacterium]
MRLGILLLALGVNCYSFAQDIDSLINIHESISNKEEKQRNYKIFRKNIDGIKNTSSFYKLMDIFTKAADDTALAYCMGHLGITLHPEGDYNNALYFLNMGIEGVEKLKDTATIAHFRKEMGLVFRTIKNYDEALKYSYKAISIIEKYNSTKNYNSRIETSNYFYVVSRIYLDLNKLDSAEFYLQKGLTEKAHRYNEDSLRKNGRLATIMDLNFRSYYLQAFINLKRKDTALARTYLQKIMDIPPDSLILYVLDRYCESCFEYAKLQNNKLSSLSFLSLAFNIAKKYDLKEYIAESSRYIYEYYLKNNNRDSSLHYLQIFTLYSDSVNNAKKNSEIQNTAFLIKWEQKEKEELQKKGEEIRNRNLQYSVIAIFLAILLTIFFLFSYTIIVSSTFIKIIGTITFLLLFEFINVVIHPYLSEWLHESPALMLLALVIIASLLAPFYNKMEHFVKEHLVEKNNKIRIANAKKVLKEFEDKS